MTSLLFLLFLKHFICDFPLQAFPWMYKNKGTYGHPGGVAHAMVHAVGTWIVILWHPSISDELALAVGMMDGVLHYHIDWAKMTIGRACNLKPTNSDWFWILLGFDQYLHHLTYFILAGLII